MRHASPRHASWQSLLTAPAPGSHSLQVYDTDDFLAAAVAHFALAGFESREIVVLTGTPEHLDGVKRVLASRGVDVAAAERRNQLVLTDAQQCLEAVTRDGLPDRVLYEEVAGTVLGPAVSDERYGGVRWWGEVSNLYLHRLGSVPAAVLDEQIGDAIVKKYGVALLCSFLCDKFNAASYENLHALCCEHEHVIPAEDYALHRQAINAAIREVVGELRGPLLQSLATWQGMPCDMPSSQSVLFWLREALPREFPAVLERASRHAGVQPGGAS